MRPVLAFVLLGTLAACGPTLATKSIISADVEIDAARAAGAEKTAPYEYYAAEAYLHEARMRNGYAEYEPAQDYAEKARTLAEQAKKKAVGASNRPEAK